MNLINKRIEIFNKILNTSLENKTKNEYIYFYRILEKDVETIQSEYNIEYIKYS